MMWTVCTKTTWRWCVNLPTWTKSKKRSWWTRAALMECCRLGMIQLTLVIWILVSILACIRRRMRPGRNSLLSCSSSSRPYSRPNKRSSSRGSLSSTFRVLIPWLRRMQRLSRVRKRITIEALQRSAMIKVESPWRSPRTKCHLWLHKLNPRVILWPFLRQPLFKQIRSL